MKYRLLALGLCVCLVLSLCACTPVNSDDAQASPTASLEPDGGEPLPSLAPDGEPALAPADPSHRPSDAPESQSPDLSEVGTRPIETAPADQPAPSAQPEKEWTAADVYAAWLTTSSQFPAPAAAFVDMSQYVDAYYTPFSADDVESFVFYQPGMSATPQDVFIAKAKPGKVAAVKAACQGRLEAMREETKFYTGTDDYVKSARLETAGDWVVLAACPEAERLVKMVRDTAK